MPAISVVLPTRDRPAFVRQALTSLAAQEFADFEVIVADNPMTAPAKEVVAEVGDERFRYLRAERSLSMHDNWEAGCAAVTGDYVGVMIDKTLWLPSTMSHAMSILDETSASVLSWWASGFEPHDEQSSLTRGDYYPFAHPPRDPIPFSGPRVLAEAMAFSARRGLEGPAYFRGKICFGLYRRDVLDGIRERVGRLFPPICPDYTSRVGAFLTAPSFVDAGVPLQFSYSSDTSTGRRIECDPSFAKRFLDEIDAGSADPLPIAGVYASQHNIVAHDYLLAEALGEFELNRLNLATRVREDLDLVEHWPDSKERREQYRWLVEAELGAGRSRLGIYTGRVAQRVRSWIAFARAGAHRFAGRTLSRMPRLRRALRTVLRRPPVASVPKGPGTLAGAILAAETQLTGKSVRSD